MKIKKIAILTRRAGYNMGTSLQAVAMSRFIADAGYPNIIIDYDEYAGHLLWQLKPAVNRLILSVMNLCPMISRLLYKSKYDKLNRMHSQINTFREFEHRYMYYSPNPRRLQGRIFPGNGEKGTHRKCGACLLKESCQFVCSNM